MKLKFIFTAALSFAISLAAIAQNNLGIDYFKLGELDLAKRALTKDVAQDPVKANYYLGEIAFREGKLDEAKTFYQKSLAAEAENPYGEIGLAKLDFKANTKEATKTLNNIAKKNKKNAAVIIEVAQAFLDNGDEETALLKAEDARKADKKSPWAYIFLGDISLKNIKPGDAAAQYAQAVTFDPTCAVADIKSAKIYEHINPNLATERLQAAIESRPDYTVTYKYLGDVYYTRKFYKEAMDAYNKFFATGNYAIKDITNYAAANYFTDNFAKANELIEEGLKHDANNFVLNRLRMYSQAKEKNYDAAEETAKKFFSIVRTDKDTTKYIPLDYTMYADVLKAKGDIEGAMAQIDKAIELDPEEVKFYKEAALELAKEENYAGAAQMHAKFIDKKGESAEANDYFQLGRYYYSAAQKEGAIEGEEAAALRDNYIQLGTEAFNVVAERVPDSHLGAFWAGRISWLGDPDSSKGLAKEGYLKAIEIINTKEEHNNKNELVEAHTYLAMHYYQQWIAAANAKKTAEVNEAKANMQSETEKLLEVDPQNAHGLQFLEVLKQ